MGCLHQFSLSKKDYQCTSQYTVEDRRLIMLYTEEHPILPQQSVSVYSCKVHENAPILKGKLVQTTHLHRFYMTQLITGDPGQPGWDDVSKHVKNKFVQ